MEANSDSANVSSNSSNDKEESIQNIFVNHAEIAWQEMRKKWVGDPSKRTSEMPVEPVISFNATYEDLLISNTPFHKPIPLTSSMEANCDSANVSSNSSNDKEESTQNHRQTNAYRGKNKQRRSKQRRKF